MDETSVGEETKPVFKPQAVSDADINSLHKTLLLAIHGWGKTKQAEFMAKRYGKGFIISGESGLRTIRQTPNIDFMSFTNWLEFREICRLVGTPEFKAQGYKWIMVDSLTEVGDVCMVHMKAVAAEKAKRARKEEANNFAVWDDYKAGMLGAAKFLRDQPYHVVATCLVKETRDDNGEIEYWPMVANKDFQRQLPGIFDHVFGGFRVMHNDDPTNPKLERYIATQEVKGWKGKAREDRPRLSAVEQTGDITVLFDLMDMPDDEHQKWLAERKAARAASTAQKED